MVFLVGGGVNSAETPGEMQKTLMQALKHLQILDPGRGEVEFIPPLRRHSIHLNDEGVPRSFETASS